MLPEKQKQTYEAFFESTANNEILDQKTTTMIKWKASVGNAYVVNDSNK